MGEPVKKWEAWAEIGDRNPVWTKVGVAFTNRDGTVSIVLDVVPLDGRVQLRPKEVE